MTDEKQGAADTAPDVVKGTYKGIPALIYPNGTILRDDEIHYLMKGPDEYRLTPERSMELHEIARKNKARAKILGKIKGAGLEVPEDISDEELEQLNNDVTAVLFAHMTKVYLKTNDLGDLSASLPKLTDTPETTNTLRIETYDNEYNTAAWELIRAIQEKIAAAAIEGEIVE